MNTRPGAQRYDLYAFIHKGLRAAMAHALLSAGRLDVNDLNDLAQVRYEIGALLDFCAGHLEHENCFVHPAMESRRPGSTQDAAGDHAQHEATIADLRKQLAAIGHDEAAAHGLYRALSTFVAENLEHMEHEEAQHNAVLWATHRDDELRAIEQRILASLTPAQTANDMRWMLPHLSPDERAGLLGGLREAAPREAFDGVIGLVRPLLGGRDWNKLSIALGL